MAFFEDEPLEETKEKKPSAPPAPSGPLGDFRRPTYAEPLPPVVQPSTPRPYTLPATGYGSLASRLAKAEQMGDILPTGLNLALAESLREDELDRAVPRIARMYDVPLSYILGGKDYRDMIDPETGERGLSYATIRRLRNKFDAQFIEQVLRREAETVIGSPDPRRWMPSVRGAPPGEVAKVMEALARVDGTALDFAEALATALAIVRTPGLDIDDFAANLSVASEWSEGRRKGADPLDPLEMISMAHALAAGEHRVRSVEELALLMNPGLEASASLEELQADIDAAYATGDPIEYAKATDALKAAKMEARTGGYSTNVGDTPETKKIKEQLEKNPRLYLELAEELRDAIAVDQEAFQKSRLNRWLIRPVGAAFREVDQAVEGSLIFTGRVIGGGLAGAEDAYSYANEGWHEAQVGELNLFRELHEKAGLPEWMAFSMQMGLLFAIDPFIVGSRAIRTGRRAAVAPGLFGKARLLGEARKAGLQADQIARVLPGWEKYVLKIDEAVEGVMGPKLLPLAYEDGAAGYFREAGLYRGKVVYGGRPLMDAGYLTVVRDLVRALHPGGPSAEAADTMNRLLKAAWIPDDADPVFKMAQKRYNDLMAQQTQMAADSKRLTWVDTEDEWLTSYLDEADLKALIPEEQVQRARELNEAARALHAEMDVMGGSVLTARDWLSQHHLFEAPTRPLGARAVGRAVTTLEGNAMGRRILKTMSRNPSNMAPVWAVSEAVEWGRRTMRRTGVATTEDIATYNEAVAAAARARQPEVAMGAAMDDLYRTIIIRKGEQIGYTREFAESWADDLLEKVTELNARRPSLFGVKPIPEAPPGTRSLAKVARDELGKPIKELTDDLLQTTLTNYRYMPDILDIFAEMEEAVGAWRRLQRGWDRAASIFDAERRANLPARVAGKVKHEKLANPDRFMRDQMRNINRTFLAYWKPAVLLRVGYIPRVIIIDEGLRIMVDTQGVLEKMAATKIPYLSRKAAEANWFSRVVELPGGVTDELREVMSHLPRGSAISLIEDAQGARLVFNGPQALGYQAAAASSPGMRDLMAQVERRSRRAMKNMSNVWEGARRFNPSDKGYDRVLSHVLANQIAGSPLGREVLLAITRGESVEDAVRGVQRMLQTPAGNKIAREAQRIGQTQQVRWAEDVAAMTYYYTGGSPQAAALALVGGGTDERLLRAVVGEGRLPTIHGPLVAHALGFDPFNTRALINRMMKAFISAPDDWLARMPYYRIWKQRAAKVYAEQIALTRRPAGAVTPQPPTGSRLSFEMTRDEYARTKGPDVKRRYHGTYADDPEFMEFSREQMDQNALAGPAVYVTDDPLIASEYGLAAPREEAFGRFSPTPESARLSAQGDAALLRQKALARNEAIVIRLGEPRLIPAGSTPDYPRVVAPTKEDVWEVPAEVYQSPRQGGNVRPLFLDVQKPLDWAAPVTEDFIEEIAASIRDLASRRKGFSNKPDLTPDEMANDFAIDARGANNEAQYATVEGPQEWLHMRMTGYDLGRYEEEGTFALFSKAEWNEVLENAGYDAIKHKGGRHMGRGVEHEVYAVFDPKKIIPAGGNDAHRTFVRRALEEGKLVPSKVLNDYPDLALEFAQQVAPRGMTVGDLRRIDAASRDFALTQLKHILYDFGETMRLDEMAGAVFPFISAWKEGYKVWANLLLRRNPAAIPYARVVLKSAMDAGFIFEDPDTGSLMVKMDWIADLADLATLGMFNKPDDLHFSSQLSSFNLFFSSTLTENAFGQGLPVPAPGMSTPALALLQHMFAETDKPWLQHYLFEYGPSASVLPRWFSTALKSVTPSTSAANDRERLANYFQRAQQWRGETPNPEKAEEQAERFWPFLALLQFISPAAPRVSFPQKEAETYWHDLLERYNGDTEAAREDYLARYPDQWLVMQGLTVFRPAEGIAEDSPSGPRVGSTEFAAQLLRQPEIRAAIKDKLFARWIAVLTSIGSENGKSETFDPSFLMAQAAAGDVRYMSPQESLLKAENREFWALVLPINADFDRREEELKARGVDVTDPAWADLKADKLDAASEIGKKFPNAWRRYKRADGYINIPIGLHEDVLSEVERLVKIDWFTAFPVGGALKDWWTLREKTRVDMEEIGVSTMLAASAKEVRAAYEEGVTAIIEKTPQFEQFYNLLLKNDLRSGIISKGERLRQKFKAENPDRYEEIIEWQIRWEELRGETSEIVTSEDLSDRLRAQYLHVVSDPEAQEAWFAWIDGWQQEEYKEGLATKRVIYMTPLDLRLVGLPHDKQVIQYLTYYSDARGKISDYLAANPDADAGAQYNALDAQMREFALADADFGKVLQAANTWGFGLAQSEYVRGNAPEHKAWQALVDALETSQQIIEANDWHYAQYDPGYRALKKGLGDYITNELWAYSDVFKDQWKAQNTGFGGLLFDDLFPDTWFRLGSEG